MNKYLLMCAAAVMGSSLSNVACASTLVHITSSCTWFVFTKNGGGLWAAHRYSSCGTSSGNWAGVQGTKDKLMHSETIQLAGAPLAQFGLFDGVDFDIQYPFADGRRWAWIANTNGQTAFILNSGTYCIATCERQRRPGTKRNALTDVIKALHLTTK
jgi:hypothetical protein